MALEAATAGAVCGWAADGPSPNMTAASSAPAANVRVRFMVVSPPQAMRNWDGDSSNHRHVNRFDHVAGVAAAVPFGLGGLGVAGVVGLSLIHISEPTR